MKLEQVIAVKPNKTVYLDGDLAIKVFNSGYSKADVLNEALNQARVEETGLPIPMLHEVTKVNDQWAIVIDYIHGKTLAELMEENPDRYDEYMELFVDLQLKIHQQTCPMLGKLKDKMNRKISQCSLDATTRYELHTRLDRMPKHNKLCHGDFEPRNVVIREDGQAYILDWAHATQGNASADAARTYLLFWLNGDIAGADKYIRLFCQKSDTAMQYVQQWLPIVAASQSVKDKPGEREFLLQWANVMDYE